LGQIEGKPLTDFGLIPVETAAASLGIEPKRLRGFMFRNRVGDPIGDGQEVYGWSCATLAGRLTNTSAVVTP
jgi:hypothetical protein